MHALRHAHHLVRWMLVWFALTLTAAVASPLAGMQGGLELVCTTGGGMKLVATNGDEASSVASLSLDCPLCSTAHAPPPAVQPLALLHQPLAYRLQPQVAARIAALTAPPLPARGPPYSL